MAALPGALPVTLPPLTVATPVSLLDQVSLLLLSFTLEALYTFRSVLAPLISVSLPSTRSVSAGSSVAYAGMTMLDSPLSAMFCTSPIRLQLPL